MKVILLQDVAKIGLRNEVVDVPNGYAANKLIPMKQAEPATPANLRKVGKVNAAKAGAVADTAVVFNAAKEALSAEALEIKADMNEQEHLFKAIDAADIVTAAGAKGITVAPQMIGFPEVVKSAGEHTVALQAGSLNASFTINVVKA
ncbi:MAG: large subunit ribosomal protein L9 [Candidatus Paceibacteria bacterium]|jgi:large subunit ribosomal protein L9